jgi:chromosome segregation ATPase
LRPAGGMNYTKALLEHAGLDLERTKIVNKIDILAENIRQNSRKLYEYYGVRPPLHLSEINKAAYPFPQVDTETLPELRQSIVNLTSNLRHSLEENVENFHDLSFQFEEKKSNLEHAYEVLEKLKAYKHQVDPREILRIVTKIKKLSQKISKEEHDYKTIESNLKIAMKEISKYYDQLDAETQDMIREQNKLFFNSSKIPKVPNTSRVLNRSLSQISIVEKEARRNIDNLKKLKNEHSTKIQKCHERIDDYRHLMNESDPNLESEYLKMQKNDQESILDQHKEKLGKIDKILLEQCSNILFRNKNLIYSEAFKDDVRKTMQQLIKSGTVKPSRIAIAIRRPIVMAPLPGICEFFFLNCVNVTLKIFSYFQHHPRK